MFWHEEYIIQEHSAGAPLPAQLELLPPPLRHGGAPGLRRGPRPEYHHPHSLCRHHRREPARHHRHQQPSLLQVHPRAGEV